MHNLALLISGVIEVFGIYLNSRFSKLSGFKKFIGFWVVMGNFGLSLVLLSYAMRQMHMSVAYAIWTGIGAVGAVMIGIVFDNEKFPPKKWLSLGLIVVAVIMLKLV